MNETEIKWMRDEIVSGQEAFCHLVAVQVMPDHVHLLLRPLARFPLSRIMKGMKGTLARKLNKLRGTSGSVWRDESFDRIVRDQVELEEKVKYMFLNPVKAGLTDDPESYVGWFIKKE